MCHVAAGLEDSRRSESARAPAGQPAPTASAAGSGLQAHPLQPSGQVRRHLQPMHPCATVMHVEQREEVIMHTMQPPAAGSAYHTVSSSHMSATRAQLAMTSVQALTCACVAANDWRPLWSSSYPANSLQAEARQPACACAMVHMIDVWTLYSAADRGGTRRAQYINTWPCMMHNLRTAARHRRQTHPWRQQRQQQQGRRPPPRPPAQQPSTKARPSFPAGRGRCLRRRSPSSARRSHRAAARQLPRSALG